METRKAFKTASVALISIFGLFIIFYWHHVNDNEQKRVDSHSQVIANAIWDFEVGGVMEYMRLASEAYKYKHIIVTQSNGEVVIEFEHSFQQPIDRLLISMHFFPTKNISSNIIYNGKVIGRIKVVWCNTAVYIYFYALIFIILILLVLRY